MEYFESKKSIADKLSTLLPVKNLQEKEEAIDELRKLGYNDEIESPKSVNVFDSFPQGNVGIYKPKEVDGKIIYERDIEYINRWTFFADKPTIPAKGDEKRVVFLGESVARGFLLDPDYTPAFVLNKLINTNSKNDKFEVIDLAETNLGMQGLKNRFTQCLDLKPDLVVFLAGNNWYEDLVLEIVNNPKTFKVISKAINEAENIAEVKPVLENVLKDLVLEFMTYVSEVMKKHDFPVIMAIPEFNLLDCRSTPGERRVTYLAGDGIKRWSEAYRKAQDAQSRGELEEVAAFSQEMIDIDPSHPLGYEMLADVKIEQQDFDAAREYFELGRDTAIFNRSNSKPRTFQISRKTILENAQSLGINVLDIPEVFKKHLNGKVPGKELFLDYCHFTAEGMQVAMEPLADMVLALTGNENTRALKASGIKPPKHALGMGHFYAAIHNEHWGQSYYLHKYHCHKALEASKDIVKIMVYYCDMISRSVTNNLTKSLELLLVQNVQADRYGHALTHPKGMKLMEIELVNAMVDALQVNGINLATFVNELRKKEHGIEGKTINLLSPFYHATSFDEFQGIQPAFYQARDMTSTFYVVAGEGISADLHISLRVPAYKSTSGEVDFFMNGRKVSSVNADSKWVNHELAISGDFCKDGINELTISWPIPDAVDKPVNQEPENSKAVLNSMYYVFGEISSLNVTGVKEPEVVDKPLESQLS